MQGAFGVDGYEPEGLLGVDAIGESWLARELSSGVRVGLRRVRPARDVDWHQARRLVTVLEQLDHPGLLRLREMLPYDDELVFCFDHPEGGDLDALLTVRTGLDPGETATIASTVADVLAALHERGVVHGDLRTASIRFTADGRPLLADVGLGALVAGIEPTAADDVFGLAAVCYTALSGTPVEPSGAHRPLHQAAPGAPAALAHVVEAGLRPEPADRPAIAAFGAQVVAAVTPTPVRLPDRPAEPFAPLAEPAAPVEEIEVRPNARGLALGLAIGLPLAALVLVLGALVGWWLVTGGGSNTEQWVGVVERLDERRAAAWRQLDADALREVYVPGSDALAEDEQRMVTFEAAGFAGARRLRTPIEELRVVSEADDKVVLEVRSRVDPYVIVADDGAQFQHPGALAEDNTITLVPHGDDWRIAAISGARGLPEPDSG